MNVFADARDREMAARDVSHNLVVAAGAGTGKTSLLVERILNLVLTKTVALERLVAMTFTDKAAAELRNRITTAFDEILHATGPDGIAPKANGEAARSLDWVLAQGHPRAEVHRLAAGALERLDRAAIGTIHSYCSDLLRRHPREAELPPDFSVGHTFEMDPPFDRLWPEFLARELGANPERFPLWQSALRLFGEGEVETVARFMCRSPLALDAVLASAGTAESSSVLNTIVSKLLSEYSEVVPEIPLNGKKKRKIAQCMEAAMELMEAFVSGGHKAFQLASTPERVELINNFNTNPGKIENAEHIETTAKAGKVLLKEMLCLNDEAINGLLDLLRPFAKGFEDDVRRRGQLTFDHLLLYARNLLRDYKTIRKAESRRIEALLLDEFQDTDPLQYEIAFYLCPDASQGKLFIVGDPKQSIYRFRGADMSAYRRAVDQVVDAGGQELTLSTNFRSTGAVLQPINTLFTAWMGTTEDPSVSPDYRPIEAHRQDEAPGPRVELWSLLGDADANAAVRRPLEARELVREIRRLSKEDGVSYREIAVLFRAMGDISLYTRAFREADVPFVVDGGNAFALRPEVVEAVALLRALANPADPVAALAVLRSSLGGLTDSDLTAYAAGGGRFRWAAENAEVEARYPEVARVFGTLRRLRDDTQGLPLDRRVYALLTEGEFALVQTAYVEGAQRLVNVKKLAGRAAELARERRLTFEDMLQVLQEQFLAEESTEEGPLADEALNAVRLLTVHRAKGLEYGVVFLPDMGRNAPNPRAITQMRAVRHDGRVVPGVEFEKKILNSAMLLAKLENARHEEAERKRLLYVATTRAKDRLILINHNTSRFHDWVKGLAHWGYVVEGGSFPDEGELCDGVLHRLITPGAPPDLPLEPEAADHDHAYRAYQDAVEVAARPRPERFRSPSQEHQPVYRRAVTDDDSVPATPPTRDEAKALGQAVHWIMEQADPHATAEDLNGLVDDAVARTAPEYKVDEATLRDLVRPLLAGYVGSELQQRLQAATVLARELPILFRDAEGLTVTGYADLVYRIDGRIVVADYKTDRHTGDDDARTYAAQLADYAYAVQRGLKLSEPPGAEVWFLRSGRRVDVGS